MGVILTGQDRRRHRTIEDIVDLGIKTHSLDSFCFLVLSTWWIDIGRVDCSVYSALSFNGSVAFLHHFLAQPV